MGYVPSPYPQRYASLAFDGTDYFVVWQDHRAGIGSDIYGARVDTSGTVLDLPAVPISTAPFRQRRPSVAFGGINYFVMWHDSRSGFGSDIYGARVDVSMEVLDPVGIAVCTAGGDQLYASVASDTSTCLVVWEDYRGGSTSDIYGARVDTSGTVLDPSSIAICTVTDDQFKPSVAFDGTNYLVVWHDYRGGSTPDIYGARVDTSGTVLDPLSIPICSAVDGQFYPTVAFDGINYLVLWYDYRGGSTPDIYGARVNTSGTVLDPSSIPVCTASDDQFYPAVAFDGTNYLVLWQDYRGGVTSDVYCTRVDTSGTVLDPSGIAIDTTPGSQWFPSLCFGDIEYLVVWGERLPRADYDIYGTKVDTSGSVLDSLNTAISTAAYWQYDPSAIFDGTSHFIVWEDARNGYESDIYGARVDTSGTVLDPLGIPICTAGDDQFCPAVAFDGTNHLVVWHDYRSGYESDIYGARVDTSGTVLDPSGIAICSAIDGQFYPAVAFDGTNYLIVWQDY
ncbi:MAG: hypothetical protein ACE5JA_07375, partial [bacterium]